MLEITKFILFSSVMVYAAIVDCKLQIVYKRTYILLAGYERNADIHLALAFRGEADAAEEFLKKQAEVLINVENNSDNGQ